MPVVIGIIVLIVGGFVAYRVYIWKKEKDVEEDVRRDDEKRRHIEEVYSDFVDKNSIALENLEEINKKFNFFDLPQQTETFSFDNEDTYSQISPEDYLIYVLQNDLKTEKRYLNLLGKLNYNKSNFEKYYNEVGKNVRFGSYKDTWGDLNKDFLDSIEKTEFKKRLIRPQVDGGVTVKLCRTDLKGNFLDQKSDSFSAAQIKEYIKRIRNRKGDFYNDKEIWDAICRMERAKVSNAMRSHIFERDGYKCLCCGKSMNEAELEIDHIIPISIGGKSVEDNLQTLCKACNISKGTQIIRYTK